MNIEKIPTLTLISDYKKISDLEEEYFMCCRKYDPDSTYESDPVLTAIQLELGRRQIYLSKVEKNND